MGTDDMDPTWENRQRYKAVASNCLFFFCLSVLFIQILLHAFVGEGGITEIGNCLYDGNFSALLHRVRSSRYRAVHSDRGNLNSDLRR